MQESFPEKDGHKIMLEIKNASFGYKSKKETRTVVSSLNLTLEKGQLVCLLGANGAGKTTVFRTVLKNLPLLSGDILVDGKSISEYTREQLAAKIAYVPQQHTPPFPYTVLQVVEMGRCIHIGRFSSPSKEDEKLCLDILCELGINDLAEKNYTELSGGERQLVLIARALAQESEYLLLDEPASSLDYGNQALLLKKIRELCGKNIGICMIMHDPEQVLTLDCTAAVILSENSFRFGKASDIINADLIRELYGIPAEMHEWTDKNGAPVKSIRQLF